MTKITFLWAEHFRELVRNPQMSREDVIDDFLNYCDVKETKINRVDRKQKKVLVSGGFDPLHIGHVRMFKEAKKLGDYLIVLVNNDNWVMKKKGYVFMHENDRVEIIKALECVDEVILTSHGEDPSDMSISDDLRIIRPDVFANGGDRINTNTPENEICEEYGIQAVYNVGGGKIRSSSELVNQRPLGERK